MRPGRPAALALLAAGLLACEPRGPASEPAPSGSDAPVQPGAEAGGLPVPPAGVPTNLRSLEVRGLGERRFLVTGAAPEGTPTVEITVEDGHNILYGPETVPVEGGRFSVELEVAPSEIQRVYAYLTTPDGAQLVVPIQMEAGSR